MHSVCQYRFSRGGCVLIHHILKIVTVPEFYRHLTFQRSKEKSNENETHAQNTCVWRNCGFVRGTTRWVLSVGRVNIEQLRQTQRRNYLRSSVLRSATNQAHYWRIYERNWNHCQIRQRTCY